MVAKRSADGIVVTTRAESTPALDELMACCEWPLVTGTNARRLHDEQALHDPECVLFWLDDWSGVAMAAKLMSWLRERGARPFRIAVAYELEHHAEPALRSAGAHGYVPIEGDVTRAATGALWPLVDDVLRRASASTAIANHSFTVLDGRFDAKTTPNLVRPP